MTRKDALTGALVADAASMGLHWLYDQEQIKTVAASGDILFRQPEPAVFLNKRGHFAHSAKRAGELSHYGESARIVGQLAAESEYKTSEHRQRFFEAFGPCGSYTGYADKPTKALVAKMINEGEEPTEPTGMDDNQMPAICVVPGLFASSHSSQTISSAVQVISINKDVIAAAGAVHHCLELIADGRSLSEALSLSAESMEGNVAESMQNALAIEPYSPLDTAQRFGLACYVEHSMPVIWHLLKHASDYESVVRDNIRCGGDSCGRGIALGAIAGLAFGIPETLLSRMK